MKWLPPSTHPESRWVRMVPDTRLWTPGLLLVSLSRVTLEVKNPPVNAGEIRDADSVPGPGRSCGRGPSNPLQYSCLENPHGQRSLVNYRPWGHKELDMTEQLSTHTHTHTHNFIATMFTVTKIWKQPKWTMERWMDKKIWCDIYVFSLLYAKFKNKTKQKPSLSIQRTDLWLPEE